jgi:hypothetical protein
MTNIVNSEVFSGYLWVFLIKGDIEQRGTRYFYAQGKF